MARDSTSSGRFRGRRKVGRFDCMLLVLKGEMRRRRRLTKGGRQGDGGRRLEGCASTSSILLRARGDLPEIYRHIQLPARRSCSEDPRGMSDLVLCLSPSTTSSLELHSLTEVPTVVFIIRFRYITKLLFCALFLAQIHFSNIYHVISRIWVC
jgi:hypothetical protein